MRSNYRRLIGLFACLMLAGWSQPAHAYIGGPPASLGMMCWWSTHVMSVKVERVDKAKNLIVFRKMRDIKGKWPKDTVNQVVNLPAPDRQLVMEWAEVGKITVICALESYKWSHTYIDRLWYAAPTTDWQWWTVSHTEPILLRTYAGRPERLIGAMDAMMANREVVVPCMVGDNQVELQKRSAKMQRVRSSLKLLDYNPKRDFVAWGSDDLAKVSGLPGFSHFAPLTRLGPDAQAVSISDFNGDSKPDLLLTGANRIALMRNEGDAFSETPLPGAVGARAAVWADYNGDGKPDLLLATAAGPKLYTNLGDNFRDDTALLPVEETYNLTAAAWLDYDGDGKPDILLGNGFHGLRVYRNKGKSEPVAVMPGKPPVQRWFDDVSDKVGLGEKGIGSAVKGDTLTVADVNGDGKPDFLYGAGSGLLVLNTDKGFVEAKDHGISYKPGRVGPVFADFDNDGHLDLFIPQNGVCKLFKGDGKGHFADVSDKSGGLSKSVGQATCAAWGDFDNDGKLDLVVGCLKGSNRFFRNKGNGEFEDATDEVGLGQRLFNTQAICLVDLNGDGVLDMVFNNEGQESCVLLGNPEWGQKMTPLVVSVKGKEGVLGSKVRVLDKEGKLHGSHMVSGGDGRGGQASPTARFALKPGMYKVEVQYSTGIRRSQVITVASVLTRGVIDDTTPQAN